MEMPRRNPEPKRVVVEKNHAKIWRRIVKHEWRKPS
jgi:hypothetical protein